MTRLAISNAWHGKIDHQQSFEILLSIAGADTPGNCWRFSQNCWQI